MAQQFQTIVLPKIFAKADFYYQVPDIVMTDDGDLKLNSTGDLDLDVSGNRAFRSEIIKRILTEHMGLVIHPEYGAGLDRACGEPINQTLAETIKTYIYRSLTDDNRVKSGDIIMEVARVDEYTLAVILVIDLSFKRISFPLFLMNTDTGSVVLGD